MKAGFLLAALAVIGGALWFSGMLSPPARHLLITGATAHPTKDGQIAAILTIENQGAPDYLASVKSSTVEASLHNIGSGLPIRAGISSLALDAAHIRIAPPATLFEEGALLPLTLTFALAGEVSAKARFTSPDAKSTGAHMTMGHGAMLHSATDAPTIAVSAKQTKDGWTTQITTENFVFSEELQDSVHVSGTGHGHIYLGGMKLGRVFADSYDIGQLPKGRHELRITLNTNDHRSYMSDGQVIGAKTIIVVD